MPTLPTLPRTRPDPLPATPAAPEHAAPRPAPAAPRLQTGDGPLGPVRGLVPWLLAVGGVALALALQQGPLDRALFLTINAWGAQAPGLWSALSVAGLGLSLLLVVGATGPRQARTLGTLLLTILLGGLLVQSLKWTLADARPLAVLGADQVQVLGERLHGRSMPSGHTAMAFAGLVLAWTRLPQAGARALAVVLACAIALSRSAVGAHWPSDLLAGAVLGAAVAWSVDHARARRGGRTGFATDAEVANAGSGHGTGTSTDTSTDTSTGITSVTNTRAITGTRSGTAAPSPSLRRGVAIALAGGAVALVLQPTAGPGALATQLAFAACGLWGAARWWAGSDAPIVHHAPAPAAAAPLSNLHTPHP